MVDKQVNDLAEQFQKELLQMQKVTQNEFNKLKTSIDEQLDGIKKALIIVQEENEKSILKMLQEFNNMRSTLILDINSRVEIVREDIDKRMASQAVENFFNGNQKTLKPEKGLTP